MVVAGHHASLNTGVCSRNHSQLASDLLRIFASVLIRDIGRQFYQGKVGLTEGISSCSLPFNSPESLQGIGMVISPSNV